MEVRDALHPSQVLATSSALLERDGDIKSVLGNPVIFFPTLPAGDYVVALRHRNHLGLATKAPWFLSTQDPPMVDFCAPTLDVLGNDSAGKLLAGSKRGMWAGDLNGDAKAVYQGPGNDVFHLFADVMSSTENTEYLANFILAGYRNSDLNLDGMSIYQGPNNDRAMLLMNTVLSHPTNTGPLANYLVSGFSP